MCDIVIQVGQLIHRLPKGVIPMNQPDQALALNFEFQEEYCSKPAKPS